MDTGASNASTLWSPRMGNGGGDYQGRLERARGEGRRAKEPGEAEWRMLNLERRVVNERARDPSHDSAVRLADTDEHEVACARSCPSFSSALRLRDPSRRSHHG